ncbi:MAG: DotD protein [uncultured bacterium]|nr:MAG: DotD protein [uncultured bacterium]
MKTNKKFLAAIPLLVQLIGCATESKIDIISNDKDLRTADVKLAATADSVSKSLKELAEIDRAIHPHAKLPCPIEPDMVGMGQLGSIDWSGPVGPLVKKIAEATNYKLKVLGTPPAIPALVSITAKDTPLADILRDAGFQCGGKANIVIYPASKIIELRYIKP